VCFLALTPTLSKRERGQAHSEYALPSPFGRGTEGEGIRATMLIVLRILQHFPEAGRYQLNRMAQFLCRAVVLSQYLDSCFHRNDATLNALSNKLFGKSFKDSYIRVF